LSWLSCITVGIIKECLMQSPAPEMAVLLLLVVVPHSAAPAGLFWGFPNPPDPSTARFALCGKQQ
jgi:hypothetical protein